MISDDLKAESIEVTKTETVHTFRQTIRPSNQTGIPTMLETLWTALKSGRFTGHVTLHLNQGGLRDIVTEQRLPE